MLKSKFSFILKVSSLVGCIFVSGCSGNGMKLILSTAKTDQNVYVGVMLSEKKGIVVGEKGIVLYTEDAGETWNADKTIAPLISDLSAVDENLCYLNGDTMFFMKTTDGGKTKEILPHTEFGMGKGVDMLDENVGWIWGRESLSHGLYEYDDSTFEGPLHWNCFTIGFQSVLENPCKFN